MPTNPITPFSEKLNIVSFLPTYLKPEMLHVYRQLHSLPHSNQHILTQKVENLSQFPTSSLTPLPRPCSRELRRFVYRHILHQPIQIYPSEARKILQTFHALQGDLLHIYFGHVGTLLLPLLKIRNFPTILSFHGADATANLQSPKAIQALQSATSLVDLILVRSQSLLHALQSLQIPNSKLLLHRTGIPLADFPISSRSLPTSPTSPIHLLQASRLIPKKGLLSSLEMFDKFVKKRPGSTFTIAGTGPMESELKEKVNQLGLTEQVKFPGFCSQESLRKHFTEAHIFLHPSETAANGDQEGVPNSMLEAMATGLPVAATLHGGIPEALTSGRSGILVPERDPDALLHAVETLIQSPEAYQRFSEEAAQEVREKFDLQKQGALLEQYYHQAIAIYSGVR